MSMIRVLCPMGLYVVVVKKESASFLRTGQLF